MQSHHTPAACLALLAASTLAGPVAACEDGDHVVIRSKTIHDGDAVVDALVLAGHNQQASVFADGDRTVEVTVDNGDVKVIVNGEEIPANRIKNHDGKLTIIGEDGKELDAFTVFVNPGGDAVVGGFGNQWRFAQGDNAWFGEVADPPNVMIGVTLGEPSPALLKHLRLEKGEATLITSVFDGLPAERAGLEQYDVIVAIEGETPANGKAIRDTLAELDPGDEVTLTVIQAGRTREFSLDVDAYDAQALAMRNMRFGPEGQNGLVFIPEGDQPGAIRVLPPGGSQSWEEWTEQFSEQFGPQWQGRFRADVRGDREAVDVELEDLQDRLRELRKLIDQLTEEHDHPDEN